MKSLKLIGANSELQVTENVAVKLVLIFFSQMSYRLLFSLT